MLSSIGLDTPVLVTEGGLAAVHADWGIADVVLDTAGPAKVDTRIRLALGRAAANTHHPHPDRRAHHRRGLVRGLARGKRLDLTYKEFQLLHFFATHPSRVFTREQLLSEVWGYDYFGGTRTSMCTCGACAKLGDLEQLIGTVRSVGYRFAVGGDDTPGGAP